MLPESEIEPVEDLPTLDDLPEGDPAIVDTAVVLKLNGGLGTSMGMTKAKSLIEAKEGETFLDIVVGQVLGLRERFGARLPLVLMNSFATRDDSLAALRRHPEIESDVPLDFLQNKVPKIDADRPAAGHLGARRRRWNGRLPATATSTRRSSARGCSTPCSSTATATPSSRTPTTSAPSSTRASSPGWRSEELPFAMEVAGRTEADRKGGHIARLRDGGLVLRETAQTPDEDLASLQDVGRHRYVNTNNLWVGLEALRDTLHARDGVLGLPIIVNRKTVDPSDSGSHAGRAARDGDGRGDRRLRGRPRAARPAAALRAGQDDQRPARPALRRLRAAARITASSWRPSARTRRSSTSTPTTTSWSATSSRASRRARRRSWRASASR